jgi:hypothetical protein
VLGENWHLDTTQVQKLFLPKSPFRPRTAADNFAAMKLTWADVLTLVLFSHSSLWKERSNVPHRSPLGAAL